MNLTLAILMLLPLLGILAAFLIRKGRHASAKGKSAFSDADYTRDYEAKKLALETVLGPMHNVVGHAIFPFQIGGAVDLYYFPNGIPGTGFATMELIQPDGSGPKPNRTGTFELVAFSKLKIPGPETKRDEQHPFTIVERRMCGALTAVGHYSFAAVLNAGETCEVPDGEGRPAKCLILEEFRQEGTAFTINGRKHSLLLCLEVFRSEMEYAMKHGSAAVLEKLKEKGYYPYSDLDRDPVF